MNHQLIAAALLLDLSATIALVDGAYLHLYRYRLYARAASRTEHVTHTARAVVFAPMIYLLFGRCFAGAVLWATLAIVLVDFAIQSWDVLVEGASRASLGGLSSLEYWIHVATITTHVAAVTLVLAARPPGAWSLSAPAVLPVAWPAIAHWSAIALIPGAAGLAVLHLWLLLPRYRAAT